MTQWQQMGRWERNDFIEWLDDTAKARWEKGRVKYHSDELGFQGQPLDHAIEEAFDLLVYLWYTRRQRKEERRVRYPEEEDCNA